ncbi:protein arginine N-methyltransferase 7-like [Uloborus diversus]|uniref:protein arginine N-methyltransferase 7-like n=1 Tax=Uloborus diversus TaxID=327109 RepID=UPI00240A953F|nr:protein arginine N-methyltransferase 7-like [Uloborus diversus]
MVLKHVKLQIICQIHTFFRDKRSLTNMSVFRVSVNPLIGKKEWIQEPEHYDYYQEVARSAYADMLHDTERNQKYYVAIKKAVKSMKEQGRLAKVLDIGTGTGLLSMMAARSGADSITACEVFRPVAKCAEDVIKENGFEGKIKVVLKHSTDLTVGEDGDLKEKANILVAEVFDTELIGEGALKTFHHALNNLLEPDCIVIPSEASVFVQVIDSPLITSWNKLYPITVDSDKCIYPPKCVVSCPGSASVHDVQMSQIPKDKFHALTEPVCVFTFDFTGKKSIEMNETFIKQVSTLREGNCDVVFMWWDLKMDMDGAVILCNGPKWMQPDPKAAQWRDHWMQAIYYLPEAVAVSKGDKITLTAYHDEYSLWFAIPKANNKKLIESPTCKCLVHVSDSHSRIAMKNDTERNSIYVQMLKEVVIDKICLCVSDGSLLPLIIAKLGAKKVFTVESSSFHQNMIESYKESNDDKDVIHIIKKEPVDLTLEDLGMEKVNVVVAEPYFSNCLRPWELLTFWHLRKVLNPLLEEDAVVVPEVGKINAVGVEFDDLWRIRAPVKNAEGFNLSKFDEMIQKAISIADTAVEPHPLWEYPCKPVTDVFNLLQVDFQKNSYNNNLSISGKQAISSKGVCNAVVLWTDYCFKNSTLKTGPIEDVQPNSYVKWYMNLQQGVYFVQPPVHVSETGQILEYKISINLDTAETSFNFNVIEVSGDI